MGHVAFSAGLAKLSANEYLVMAGTLHGVHAITSRISPVPKSSGVQTIEAETFKMTILLTQTGERLFIPGRLLAVKADRVGTHHCSGIKFVLLTSLNHSNPDSVLQKLYEACEWDPAGSSQPTPPTSWF
jgi:hypothetical protein